MRFISTLFLALLIISCKRENIDNSPTSLIVKYDWHPYQLIDTFFSVNLDTMYRIQSNLFDSCDQASSYKFYSDGKVNRFLPCYLTPNVMNGTWSLTSDSVLSVSVGFTSSLAVKLISIDNRKLTTNTKWPYHILSSSAPPEFGIRSTTTVFRHK